jgi:rhamnosyltransferase
MSNDNNIAMSYGRQLPKADATILSEFARLNNYPDRSTIKSKEDIISLGIKTCFISNSFAAYKKDKLMEFGSFPTHLIMCEDVYVGAKSILLDSKIAYVAEAKVYHSHNYTIGEEFKRYFDIGFFYNSESWILDKFKSAESEGLSYLKREFLFLVNKKKMLLIPEFVFRSAFKYGGFLMGKYQRVIPLRLKRRFSMHAYFWKA